MTGQSYLRVAYADPPYPGQSKKHYADHPDFAGEVDHRRLLEHLVADYPDGWALSTGSNTLQEILALCPPGVRVMAWVKPFCSFKKNVNPAYAWEPVIVRGGRRRAGDAVYVRDWVAAHPPAFSGEATDGTHGAKPRAFAFWLFEVLGLRADDEIVDMFPGSGAISRAWASWASQGSLLAA